MEGLMALTCMTITANVLLAFNEEISTYFGLLEPEPAINNTPFVDQYIKKIQ
jgi:hypothetical protein